MQNKALYWLSLTTAYCTLTHKWVVRTGFTVESSPTSLADTLIVVEERITTLGVLTTRVSRTLVDGVCKVKVKIII